MANRYTEETKKKIVALYKAGTPSFEICETFGIARSSLYLWVKQYSPDAKGQIPRELYLQELELKRLRIQNEIYRKTGCTPSSALADRLKAIDIYKDEFNIYRMCQTLEVNKSTYYYHTLRVANKTQVQIMDDQLKPKIIEVFTKSNSRFGARRIRIKLMEQGFTVSERRISRLMKELNLSTKVKTPRINSAYNRIYYNYPNKLNRDFTVSAPNKFWVSDITYIKTHRIFVFLCVIIDLFSRKVLAYDISHSIDTRLVMRTFDKAFMSRGCPDSLIFHSDRGCQYTSETFCNHLKENNVEPSYSAPGSPYDNAVAESFFATIKREEIRRNFYTDIYDLSDALDKYIDFFNDYRPHQKLSYLTPNQAESEYYQKKN